MYSCFYQLLPIDDLHKHWYCVVSIGSYPNLRDVPPNPLPERAARGQGMTAVHPADEGLEPRSPMHLRTKTKNGSYMIWPGTGLSHAPELWTRFLVQPNSLEGFWKKHSSYFERKGRYVSRKLSLEQLIVSGICCWRLRLLRRFFRSDKLLSIFVDSELQRTFSRATWLHLELHRSSHWN